MHTSSGAVVSREEPTAAAAADDPDRHHFAKCVSDPKLIVARHVFGDSDDFCKKTLDITEQI